MLGIRERNNAEKSFADWTFPGHRPDFPSLQANSFADQAPRAKHEHRPLRSRWRTRLPASIALQNAQQPVDPPRFSRFNRSLPTRRDNPARASSHFLDPNMPLGRIIPRDEPFISRESPGRESLS